MMSEATESFSLENDISNIANQITEIAKSFEKWIVLRLDTISSLREVADVIGK